MMRFAVVAFAVSAVVTMGSACGPLPPEAKPSKLWSAKDFVANARRDKAFGFIASRMLGVETGDVIPWRSPPFELTEARQGIGRGLPLWPAFADGKTASMLITEIWQNHPAPWVQPVYQFLKEGPAVDGVFAVDDTSTFYTPYWRAELATVPAETAPKTFTSVAAILNSKVPVTKSVMVMCPIVPADVAVAAASGETLARRPMTGEPVTQLSHAKAWVNGVSVEYLGIGFHRQTVTGSSSEVPVETPLYFFVKAPGSAFSLPPILPTSPMQHSFHRRYEVPLAAPMGVFVPASRPELKALLQSEGAPVPDAHPAISDAVGKPYLLRVAANASECFANAATFPAACIWLDSQTALEANLQQDVRVRTEVTMAVSTLQVGSTP